MAKIFGDDANNRNFLKYSPFDKQIDNSLAKSSSPIALRTFLNCVIFALFSKRFCFCNEDTTSSPIIKSACSFSEKKNQLRTAKHFLKNFFKLLIKIFRQL